jgi:hypothetical protein
MLQWSGIQGGTLIYCYWDTGMASTFPWSHWRPRWSAPVLRVWCNRNTEGHLKLAITPVPATTLESVSWFWVTAAGPGLGPNLSNLNFLFTWPWGLACPTTSVNLVLNLVHRGALVLHLLLIVVITAVLQLYPTNHTKLENFRNGKSSCVWNLAFRRVRYPIIVPVHSK